MTRLTSTFARRQNVRPVTKSDVETLVCTVPELSMALRTRQTAYKQGHVKASAALHRSTAQILPAGMNLRRSVRK